MGATLYAKLSLRQVPMTTAKRRVQVRNQTPLWMRVHRTTFSNNSTVKSSVCRFCCSLRVRWRLGWGVRPPSCAEQVVYTGTEQVWNNLRRFQATNLGSASLPRSIDRPLLPLADVGGYRWMPYRFIIGVTAFATRGV